MRMRKHRLQSGCLFGFLLAFGIAALPAGAQTSGVNEWTWIGGSNTAFEGNLNMPEAWGTLGVFAPGNIPGAHEYTSSWTDKNGDFWLFGGEGKDSQGELGTLNDLWRFSPSSNQWAWMGGTSTLTCGVGMYGYECLVVPVFGTMGTPASSNTPGGRQNGANWVDSSGNLWLFGGSSTTPDGGSLDLNGIWEFHPSVASLPSVATPIFSLATGNYTTVQTLTISNGMTNASFHYTTDGTAPTSGSPVYSGPITISSTETVQAIGTASGYPNSALTSATYTFKAHTPTFSSPSGTYNYALSVAIWEAMPGLPFTTRPTVPHQLQVRPFTKATAKGSRFHPRRRSRRLP